MFSKRLEEHRNCGAATTTFEEEEEEKDIRKGENDGGKNDARIKVDMFVRRPKIMLKNPWKYLWETHDLMLITKIK